MRYSFSFFSNQSIAIECKTISNVTVLINKLNRFCVCDEESSKEHVLLAPCVSPVFWCANVNKFFDVAGKKKDYNKFSSELLVP